MIERRCSGGSANPPRADRTPHLAPDARSSTLREALAAALRKGLADARDPSAAVGIRARDVAMHLEHRAIAGAAGTSCDPTRLRQRLPWPDAPRAPVRLSQANQRALGSAGVPHRGGPTLIRAVAPSR